MTEEEARKEYAEKAQKYNEVQTHIQKSIEERNKLMLEIKMVEGKILAYKEMEDKDKEMEDKDGKKQ